MLGRWLTRSASKRVVARCCRRSAWRAWKSIASSLSGREKEVHGFQLCSSFTVEGADRLLQLGVLCLGLFQDGDVRIGIFPEREEIFVGSEGAEAGGVGIRAL